ncbi:Arm DNA-binding domain-containing protein [Bacillus sp. ISL-75]|uniref:Arm DNA-binding domain-containing protein n=1 Tax=Bacillus sp. ISL-75 TaxID=2819137 RepID=UPI001BE6398A|nr:Arm DNA-binding domain-containing protein [Bacillus sp. ISL-75]MBT2728367.1 Arm DNA-binding domain-containing protein [Bacillus sp. ISL-75]
MMIINRYKKGSNRSFWEFKIFYKDVFTNKVRAKKRRGFKSREEAEAAALEMMGLLRMPK